MIRSLSELLHDIKKIIIEMKHTKNRPSPIIGMN